MQSNFRIKIRRKKTGSVFPVIQKLKKEINIKLPVESDPKQIAFLDSNTIFLYLYTVKISKVRQN